MDQGFSLLFCALIILRFTRIAYQELLHVEDAILERLVLVEMVDARIVDKLVVPNNHGGKVLILEVRLVLLFHVQVFYVSQLSCLEVLLELVDHFCVVNEVEVIVVLTEAKALARPDLVDFLRQVIAGRPVDFPHGALSFVVGDVVNVTSLIDFGLDGLIFHVELLFLVQVVI